MRVVLVLLIVAGVLVYGFHRFEAWRNSPSEARRIAESATVAGFVRSAVVDMADGDNPLMAEAYFVGSAPKPDPLAVVSVPTIQLKAVPSPPESPTWVYKSFPVAKGQGPDGCDVTVAFDSDPIRSTLDLRGEKTITILTAEQLNAVHNGTQIFIKLIVGDCRR